MQLAKVVIASALVIAVCAEGLPEGKDCVLKCIPDVPYLQSVVCCIFCMEYMSSNCCNMHEGKYSSLSSF